MSWGRSPLRRTSGRSLPIRVRSSGPPRSTGSWPIRGAVVWASKMCDVTGCNVDTMEEPAALRPKQARMWHDWFRRRFADNVSYDELVRGVLCATSRGGVPIGDWVEQEAAATGAAESTFESDYAGHDSLDLYWRRIRAEGVSLSKIMPSWRRRRSSACGCAVPAATITLRPLVAAGLRGVRPDVCPRSSSAARRSSGPKSCGSWTAAARPARPGSRSRRSCGSRRSISLATGRQLIDAAAQSDAPTAGSRGPLLAESQDPRRTSGGGSSVPTIRSSPGAS